MTNPSAMKDALHDALEMLAEVSSAHKDPREHNYNECDTSMCRWCEKVDAAIPVLRTLLSSLSLNQAGEAESGEVAAFLEGIEIEACGAPDCRGECVVTPTTAMLIAEIEDDARDLEESAGSSNKRTAKYLRLLVRMLQSRPLPTQSPKAESGRPACPGDGCKGCAGCHAPADQAGEQEKKA